MDPAIGGESSFSNELQQTHRQSNMQWLTKGGAFRKLVSKLGTINSARRRGRSLSWAGAPSSSSSSHVGHSPSSKYDSSVDNRQQAADHHHHHHRLYYDIPAGHLAVYVGEGDDQGLYRRFVVKTACLSHPIFKALLARVGDEFGFHLPGPLTIPCDPLFFQYLLCIIDQSVSYNPHHHNSHHRHYKPNRRGHGCSCDVDDPTSQYHDVVDQPHDRLLDHLLRLYQSQLQPNTTTPLSDSNTIITPARATSRSLSAPNLPLAATTSTGRAPASESLYSPSHNIAAN